MVLLWKWADGNKFWYLNGKLHREDGPAMEWANGSKSWYLNDEEVTQEEHKRQTSPSHRNDCSRDQ